MVSLLPLSPASPSMITPNKPQAGETIPPRELTEPPSLGLRMFNQPRTFLLMTLHSNALLDNNYFSNL
jgi:hypothetical protein